MRKSRTSFNDERSVWVILPSQNGGVRSPRPKGCGTVERSWRSPRFFTSIVQVSESSINLQYFNVINFYWHVVIVLFVQRWVSMLTANEGSPANAEQCQNKTAG